MKETKTIRILQMLMMLSGKRYYTLKELAQKYAMSERNVLRDLETIESAGFALDRGQGYRLMMQGAFNRNLQTLLHFTEDEIAILFETLSLIEGTSSVKERLMRKMHTFYDLRALSNLRQRSELDKMRRIAESIKRQQQIRLNAYRSSNSDSIADRRVEAFDFLPDYEAVWCYDCESHSCKQFRISRMQSVEILPWKWQFEDEHRENFTDIFRYSAAKPKCQIALRLTLKAYNALIEEYPRSAGMVKEEKDRHTYYLKAPVAHYAGVSRFVLSMLEDVEVISPQSFKNHIQVRLQRFLNR